MTGFLVLEDGEVFRGESVGNRVEDRRCVVDDEDALVHTGITLAAPGSTM